MASIFVGRPFATRFACIASLTASATLASPFFYRRPLRADGPVLTSANGFGSPAAAKVEIRRDDGLLDRKVMKQIASGSMLGEARESRHHP